MHIVDELMERGCTRDFAEEMLDFPIKSGESKEDWIQRIEASFEVSRGSYGSTDKEEGGAKQGCLADNLDAGIAQTEADYHGDGMGYHFGRR